MPPKGSKKAKGKGKTKRRVQSEHDKPSRWERVEGGGEYRVTPMPFEGSDGSLASWSETDERWSFKDVSHIEEELRVRDADLDGEGCEKRPEYDLETILRWRRHPRKGYSQYRTKWGGFTIHSNTWEPEQCFDKEAIDDFWKARGGRPEDVPEIASGDETPVLDEDDTDNQKYDDGLMGEDARRRLRLEFRRDKKLFREYRRKKREEQEAEKQRKRRDQVVGSDADDDDDDDDDVPLVSRRRVRPDPVGDASKRKRADEDEDDDDDDVPLRKRLANNDINETSLSSPTEAPESAVERSRLALAPATFVRPSSAIEESPAPFYPSPLRSPNPPAAPTAAAQGRFQDSFAQRSEAGPSRATSVWPSSFPDAGPSTAAPRPQPAAEKPAGPKPAASKPASAASPPAPAVQNPGPAAKSSAQGPKAPSAPTAKPSAAQRRDHRPLSDSSRREIKMLERETKKGGSASTKASGSGSSASSVTKQKSSLPASTSTSATVSGPSTSAQAPVAGPSSSRPPAVGPAAPRPSTSTSVRPLPSAATASAATSTPASFLDAVLPPKSYKGAHKNRSQVKILENAPPEPVGPRTLGHFRARAPAVRPPPSQAAAATVGSATSGQPSRPGTSLNETGTSHAGPSSSAARDAPGRARAADQRSPPHPGSPTLDSPWYPDPPEATLPSRRGSTDMSRSTTGDSLWNEPASSSTSSRGPRRVTIDSSSANVAHADRRRSPASASGSAGGASPMGSSSYKPVSPTDYRRESASMLPPASPPLSGSNDAALGRARRWGSPQDQRQDQRQTQPQAPAQPRPPQQIQQRRQDTPPQDQQQQQQQQQQQRPQSPPGPPPLGSPPPPPPPARSLSQSQPAPPTVPPSPQPPPPPSGPSAPKSQGGSGPAATSSRAPIAPSTSASSAAGEKATANGDSSKAQAGPSMPVVSAEAPSEDELDEDAAEVDMMTAAASSASPQPPTRDSPPLHEGADFGTGSNDNEEAPRAQLSANTLAAPSTTLFAHRASTSSRPSTAKGAPPPWLNKAADKPKLTKGTPPPWLARWGPNGTARRAGGSGSGGSGAPNGSGAGEGAAAAANPPAATKT